VSRETGATLIELLVASGIMLAASAVAVSLVATATAQSPRWNEAADLHQRARVAVETIARHVALAGGDVPVIALPATYPTIEPRRRSSFLASNTAITVRHVAATAPWTTVRADVPPGGAIVPIDIHPGCAAGIATCGFVQRSDAIIVDGRGDWHLLIVEPAGPALVNLSDAVAGRTATFAAGSTLAVVQEASLYFDRGARILRQEGPGAGDFPLVDFVADLAFDYFTDNLQPILLGALVDGPLCGSGALAYDCDLRRIRTVRARLTLAATDPDTRDLRVTIDVTPRRRLR